MNEHKLKKQIVIGILLLVIGTVSTVYGALITNVLPTQIAVREQVSLSVYNETCTSLEPTPIDYGEVGPIQGDSIQKNICIRNTGNRAFFILKLSEANSITVENLVTGLSFDWTTQATSPVVPLGSTMVVTLTITNTGGLETPAGTWNFNTVFKGFGSVTG